MNYLIWGLKKSGLASLELLQRANLLEKGQNIAKNGHKYAKKRPLCLLKCKKLAKFVPKTRQKADLMQKKIKKGEKCLYFSKKQAKNIKNKPFLVDFYRESKNSAYEKKYRSDNYFVYDDDKNVRASFKTSKSDCVYLLDSLTQKTVSKMDKIIVSPGISINEPLIQFAKKQKIDVLGELELAFQFMDKSCTLVAITGTNGKTTTTELVYQILQKAGIKSEKVGNIGVPFSSKICLGERDVVYVCETSSFQLEACKTFRPHIACLVNLTPDHLDRHKDMQTYSFIKKLIFKNQNKDDVAIVPQNFKINTQAKVLYFGTKKDKNGGVFAKNNDIFIKKGLFSHKICTIRNCNLIGPHFKEDILCAVLISKILGVKNKIIQSVLQNFSLDSHRMQLVYLSKTNNRFFDDSKATNVDATIKAVQSFDVPLVLLCGGSDKNCDFDQLFLSLTSSVQKIYVFGKTANKMLASHQKMNSKVPIEKCENMRQAVYLACQEQKKIILLSPACASFDEFSSYKERGEKFLEYIKDYYENF